MSSGQGNFVPKLYFDGVGADKRLKFDPSGYTLPSFVVGKVYALDGSGDVVLASSASDLLLGIYTGANDQGYPIFEQLYYQETAAFTARGTHWYLDAAGALTTTPNDALFGISIDADTLLIIWHGRDTGGVVAGEPNTTSNQGGGIGLALAKAGYDLPFRTLSSPGGTVSIAINGDLVEFEAFDGPDVQENDVSEENPVTTLNFLSDIAGSKPFADLDNPSPGQVDVAIDKQIDYGPLAGSVGPVATGFSFVAATYRSCEVVYYLEKVTGETEAGVIVMTHDGTNAGVVVTKRDSAVAPLTAGDPGMSFSADVSGGNCRLLYTETNGDAFHLSLKPRPIRPPQVITVEFQAASSDISSEFVATHTWNIIISTSDGLPTRQQVTVDVVDLLTGSANGLDYTMTTPQGLTFPPGTADGAALSASLDVLGNNENDDVDAGLQNVVGGLLGVQTTHQINLLGAGA